MVMYKIDRVGEGGVPKSFSGTDPEKNLTLEKNQDDCVLDVFIDLRHKERQFTGRRGTVANI